MERAAGIEPASSAWKAEVLPLNYARDLSILNLAAIQQTQINLFLVERAGFEPAKLSRQIYSLIPLAAREPLRKIAGYPAKQIAACQPKITTYSHQVWISIKDMELARGVEPPTG